MKHTLILILFLLGHYTYGQLPTGFVDIKAVNPTIQVELRYYTQDNFVGQRIDGYEVDRLIISVPAAMALDKAQKLLKKQGLGLKIFDAYRPQRAVDHFVRWARVLEDTLTKAKYYPEVPKSKLFEKGYIASKSGHTRGSTVDLTIIDLNTGEELDMGSPWDFFGPISHHNTDKISEDHLQNRKILLDIMTECRFKPYPNEWWHYTLINEPFPKTYFDFPIMN